MSVKIDPRAGKGIGVNPTGADYPFLRPSDDIAGLLADLHLAAEMLPTIVYPLRISRITGLGAGFEEGVSNSEIEDGAHPVDITIVDANDVLVFESDSDVLDVVYRAREYGNRLRIHEWFDTITYCRIIQHAAFASEAEVRVIPDEIEPEEGWLDPRTCHRLPTHVHELRADPDGSSLTRISEQTILAAGYNITLTAEPDGITTDFRNATRITINAVPGTGLGKFDNCEEATLPPVKQINNVPMAGDVQVKLDPCHWLRPPLEYTIDEDGLYTTKVAEPHTLILGNDCSPCYQCEDFVHVWKALLNVNQDWKSAGILAEATRDAYHTNRERWLNQKQCREDRGVAIKAFSHHCTEVDVQIGICNTKPYCLTQVILTFVISINTGGSAVIADPESYEITDVIRVNGRGDFVAYQLDGDNPYQAYWDMIEAGGSGKLLFHIHFFNEVAGSVSIELAATTLGSDYGQPVATTFTLSGCEASNGSSSSSMV